MGQGTRVPLVTYGNGEREVIGVADVEKDGPHYQVKAYIHPGYEQRLTTGALAVSIGTEIPKTS